MKPLRAILALVAVLVAALAAAAWLGPDLARGRIEQALSRALHRPVTVAAVRFVPAWPPTMRLTGIAAAGIGTVPEARVGLGAALLWGGAGRATVRLVRPEVTLGPADLATNPTERAASVGAGNASLTDPSAGTVRQSADWRVTIEEGRLTWHDPRWSEPLAGRVEGSIGDDAYDLIVALDPPTAARRAGLSEARVTLAGAIATPLHATLAATWRGAAVAGTLDGPPPATWRGAASLPITLHLAAAGASVEARGTVGQGGTWDGHVALRAPDGTQLGPLAGVAEVPAGPLSVDADVAVADAALSVRAASVQSPAVAARVSGRVRLAGRPAIEATVEASRLDLDALRSVAWTSPGAGAPAPPAVAAAPPAPEPPPRVLRVPEGIDATVDATVASLRWHGAELRDAKARVVVRGGVLTADPLSVALIEGKPATGSLRLDGGANPPAVAVVLHAPAAPVSAILAALALPAVVQGTASVDLDVRAAGADARALAASLDGTGALRMTGGSLAPELLAPLLRTLPIPAGLPATVPVTCLAASATARAGRVTVAALALDTPSLRLDGSGTIDLGSEALDLHLSPLARVGPGISVPAHVGGTLRAPKVGVGVRDAAFEALRAAIGGLGGEKGGPCPAPAGAAAHGPASLLDLLRRIK